MHWNYRIIHVKTDTEDYYGLFEVYYSDRIPFARTMESNIFGETPQELIDTLEMALKDIKNSPVMEDDEIDEELGNKILYSDISDGLGDI